MFEATPKGFRIVFEDYPEPMRKNFVRGYVNLLTDVWHFISGGNTFRPGSAKRVIKVARLVRLSHTYFQEMLACGEAKAYFARIVIGGALVECLLLMACIRDRNRVTTSNAWRKFAWEKKKKGKLFHDLLDHLDFATLIKIGAELNWFPNDAQFSRFIYDSWGATEKDYRLYPELALSPHEAVLRLQAARNRVHAGNCLRDSFHLERGLERRGGDEDEDEEGDPKLALIWTSLLSVMCSFSGPDVTHLEFEIPEPVRAVLNRFGTRFDADESKSEPTAFATWPLSEANRQNSEVALKMLPDATMEKT